MSELDDMEKLAGGKKKKGDMKGAVEGTEAIREWVSMTPEKRNRWRISILTFWLVYQQINNWIRSRI